ncbi:MAG: hypothetical protein KA204_00595 [Chromatiaceae bacterium]|nr:hypothetical protein [Chromatiaceae bacterium]MBP6733791.1 hypothetical protein [Chromatiaceae bacterium]MBP8283071.1 hypothetical protein [Chromatiaceae bacterium]MBP8289229.1 hypothetical protein [Chromatiaceae bacterium]
MDWFKAGARVGANKKKVAQYPPLDDAEAQRYWLGGFGAAWAASDAETPMAEVLAAALHDQPALLDQLRTHGSGHYPPPA